jgi:hypothetical protein
LPHLRNPNALIERGSWACHAKLGSLKAGEYGRLQAWTQQAWVACNTKNKNDLESWI